MLIPKKTSFCIFCLTPFNDSFQASLEHIIPESIGGAVEFYCMCHKCNSDIGSLIDSKLTNDWFVRAKSQIVGVKNKKGIVPNVFKETKSFTGKDQDLECNIIINDDNKLEAEIKEIVKLNVVGEKAQINVCGNISNIDRIMEKIKTSARRKGILSKIDLDEIRQKIISESSHSQDSREVSSKFSVSREDFLKPMVKIAYEIAYYYLGEDYRTDKVGNKIHKWLVEYEDYNIENLETFISTSYTANMDNFFFNLEPHNHIVFLKSTQNKMICFVQIYDLMQIRILITNDYNKYQSCLVDNDFPLIINSATEKKASEHHFMEYVLENGVELWDKNFSD